jgi:hypothetical protein
VSSCRCGVSFTGHLTCHCAECHLTFTGLDCFDRHRAGSWEGRYCRTPAEARLVLDKSRAYECWMRDKPHGRFPSGQPNENARLEAVGTSGSTSRKVAS